MNTKMYFVTGSSAGDGTNLDLFVEALSAHKAKALAATYWIENDYDHGKVFLVPVTLVGWERAVEWPLAISK